MWTAREAIAFLLSGFLLCYLSEALGEWLRRRREERYLMNIATRRK